MIKFLALLVLIQVPAFASPREEAQDLFERMSQVSGVVERLDAFSQLFLGLPYGDGGPLGEGPDGRYDQDPLYRFDTYDCTTYLETMISLTLSRDVEEFEGLMNEIRYHNGEVDYLTRNHYPSLQWIPYNTQNGLLTEINEAIVPKNEIKLASAIINLPGWLRKIGIAEIRVPNASPEERQALLEELRGKASLYSPVRANLDYVPVNYLLDHPEKLDLIPHGTVVNFVRPNWDLTAVAGTHMNVSHQGFLFRKKGQVILRHASSTAPKTVTEFVFLDYLKKFRDHPTLKGVHFMQVN